LDGDENIHDLNRIDSTGRGTHHRVMDSIKRYTEKFSKVPEINCTVSKLTFDRRQEVLEFFTKKGLFNLCFSRLFDSDDQSLALSREEFNIFLKDAEAHSFLLRQNRSKTSDCTKYGKQCGVGLTNIFYADGKVYPCGRFVDKEEYVLGIVYHLLKRGYRCLIQCLLVYVFMTLNLKKIIENELFQ
jgi:uncharacterized protein